MLKKLSSGIVLVFSGAVMAFIAIPLQARFTDQLASSYPENYLDKATYSADKTSAFIWIADSWSILTIAQGILLAIGAIFVLLGVVSMLKQFMPSSLHRFSDWWHTLSWTVSFLAFIAGFTGICGFTVMLASISSPFVDTGVITGPLAASVTPGDYEVVTDWMSARQYYSGLLGISIALSLTALGHVIARRLPTFMHRHDAKTDTVMSPA